MLDKCANPACSARLLHFPDGRLFMRYRKCGEGDRPSCGGRCVEHYWLCATCAATLTVVFAREGVFVRPCSTFFPYRDFYGVA
jgi:hypothetical protein